MTVEPSHGGETARDARRLEAAGARMLEIRDDVVGADVAQRVAGPRHEAGEIGEVAAVGAERVPGRPPLRLEGAEKPGHGIHQAVRGAVRPFGRAMRVTTS